MAKIDWPAAFKPLLKQYKGKPHPLEAKNLYQLVVMVVLSAQDSDRNINKLAPDLFKAFPNMKALAASNEEAIGAFTKKVRNGRNKAKWLLQIAQAVKDDKKIPVTMEELTKLPGIGRKSANVIMREAGVKAEGIIVDLHVVRVAPRIGVAAGTDPKKIEQQLMEAIPQKHWGEIGMAISFLGRETCRPKHPEHGECVMQPVCQFYKETGGKFGAEAKDKKVKAEKKAAVKKPAAKKPKKK